MDLRTTARYLEPKVRIGKKGLYPNIYAEIDKLLQKRGLVKIKILNNCELEMDGIIEKVISETKSSLVCKIGRVFTIYREN